MFLPYLPLISDSFLLDAIHIINVIGPGEEVEDGRTPNAIDLSQTHDGHARGLLSCGYML